MIIRFTMENWKSYRDPTTFTMIASDENRYGRSVLSFKSSKLKLLPIAAVFGGNGSGKSNFVDALGFAQNFIVNGNATENEIPTETFLLDRKFNRLPTKFSFELLIGRKIFAYEFAVSSNKVVSESLSEIKEERKVRIFDIHDRKISIQKDFKYRKELKFIYGLKRTDQLLVTSFCKMSKCKLPVYDWFRDDLTVVLPSTATDISKLFTDALWFQTVNGILETLDCGITGIKFEDYVPSNDELEYLERELKCKPVAFDMNKFIFANKNSKKIIVKKMIPIHKGGKGRPVSLDMSNESDGTIRIINLLPVFLGLTQSGKSRVCVIDELERSLHTHLIENLITAYLDNCGAQSRSQLIFTSHNSQLMYNSNLRNDEMWLTKRDDHGSSTMYSIWDFENLQFEKNIRDSYLIGRFGGIPDMLLIQNQLKVHDMVN